MDDYLLDRLTDKKLQSVSGKLRHEKDLALHLTHVKKTIKKPLLFVKFQTFFNTAAWVPKRGTRTLHDKVHPLQKKKKKRFLDTIILLWKTKRKEQIKTI